MQQGRRVHLLKHPTTLLVNTLGRELDSETLLMYYRGRTYDQMEGRFKQLDPIGFMDGLNLYSYVGNSPSNRLDPNGHYTIIGRVLSLTLKGKFDDWYDLEKADKDWWIDLPKCPCRITFADEEKKMPVSPDGALWLAPRKKRDFPAKKGGLPVVYLGSSFSGAIDLLGFTDPPDLHPGAIWDMRQLKRTGDYGNQCMYDGEGMLITGGLGAGTVDKRYYGKVTMVRGIRSK